MSTTTARAWLQAARIPSQVYLWLPLIWGQALAYAFGGQAHIGLWWLVFAFGLCQQLYIVFANDLADLAADRLNQQATLFSGGSRVLVEGHLAPRQLAQAALVTALASLVLASVLALAVGRWELLGGAVLGLALLLAYSYPPLRLSYRGGGECLQTFGLAVLLPWIGFTSQGGPLLAGWWQGVAVLVPAHFACALATALPDEAGDRLAGKCTLVVRCGANQVFLAMALLQGLSLFLLAQGGWHPQQEPFLGLGCALPAALLVLFVALGLPPRKSPRFLLKAGLALAFNLSVMGVMTAAFYTLLG